jgi:predicted metal-dependent phosphoesterase TrpH
MIDLHCHSLYSDGTDSPAELARAADALGLGALALTDHDTLEGLRPFLAMQAQVRTRLVTGIELSCRFLGRELHLLGLFVDPENPRFRARIQTMRDRREDRNRRLIDQLHRIGIPLRLEEVAALAPSSLISRAHFAKALVARGSASSKEDAFRRLIGDGCPGHVPFRELPVGEATAWIREAGGTPVVAHPGRGTFRGFPWDGAMAELKGLGVAGFEAYYGEYGPTETRSFLELAARLDMAPSGGSDYHGASKAGIALGRGRGDLAVPDELLAELERRRG